MSVVSFHSLSLLVLPDGVLMLLIIQTHHGSVHSLCVFRAFYLHFTVYVPGLRFARILHIQAHHRHCATRRRCACSRATSVNLTQQQILVPQKQRPGRFYIYLCRPEPGPAPACLSSTTTGWSERSNNKGSKPQLQAFHSHRSM
jgi:hypothetical protein